MIASKWLIVLGICEPLAIVSALVSMSFFGIAWKFPSLLFALTIELATDVSLQVLLHHPSLYAAYFYTYWGSVFLQSAMRLWVIADVARSFPGIGFMPKSVYLFVGTAGATISIASVAYCLHGEGEFSRLTLCLGAKESLQCLGAWLRDDMSSIVMLIDRCVNVAWLVFGISLLLSAKALGLGWSPVGAIIANGISARIFAGFIVSRLISSSSDRVFQWANSFDSLCSIAVFLFWSYCFSPPPQHPEHESGDSPYTQSSLEALLAIRSGRER
jgi:hypothetical protein